MAGRGCYWFLSDSQMDGVRRKMTLLKWRDFIIRAERRSVFLRPCDRSIEGAAAFGLKTWAPTCRTDSQLWSLSLWFRVCPNGMSRRGCEWWPLGRQGRRGERWPLELPRWRTTAGAMATALMRRWFAVLGLGRMTVNLANRDEKERYRQPLFKYLLVFITQTNTSVSSLSSAPFYYTSRTLSFQKIFCDWDVSCHETSPGGPECSIMAGRELGDTLWSQVIKPQGAAAVWRFWSLTAVASVYDSKETTFTQLWAPAWALITQN